MLILAALLALLFVFAAASAEEPVFIPGEYGEEDVPAFVHGDEEAGEDEPGYTPDDPRGKDHEHTFKEEYLSNNDAAHVYIKYCTDPECGLVWDSRTEDHNFEDGYCALCGYMCSHSVKHAVTYMYDGQPRREGYYVCYDGIKVTTCDNCEMVLRREEVTERRLHLFHTRKALYYEAGEDGTHTVVYRCTNCGIQEHEQEKHTGVTIAPDQCDNDPETHLATRQCTKCGAIYEEREAHMGTPISYITDDSTQSHIVVMRCTGCNMEYQLREDHTPVRLAWKSISDDRHQASVRCKACGMAYMQEVRDHNFLDVSYKSHNDSGVPTHTVYEVCRGCGYERSTGREEAHEFYVYSRPSRNPVVCKKCGQGESHEHMPDRIYFCGYGAINEKQHAELFLCYYCDLVCTNKVYDHDFDPVTMKCKDCGYLAEDCDHTFELIAKPDGDHHTLTGQCTKCGKWRTETGEHDMQFASDLGYTIDESKHYHHTLYRCTVCGFEETRTDKGYHVSDQISATDYVIDEIRHSRVVTYKCRECGVYEWTETEQHCMDGAVSIDLATHTGTCTKCGYTGVSAHRNIVRTDYGACRDCGTQHVHSMEEPYVRVVYSPCNSITHWIDGLCTYCEDRSVLLRNERHEFEDGVCVWCGYSRNGSANDAILPEAENRAASSNDETDSAPYTLTADGNKLAFTELFLQYDGSDRCMLVLTVDEAITGGVIEWHVTLSGAEALASRGVQTLYLVVNDAQIPVLNCVDDLADAMLQAQMADFTVTGTPNADVPGGYVFSDALPGAAQTAA